MAVIPTEDSSAAKAANSDLDKRIENNLDAALIQNRMQKQVNYAVRNGVITLTGDVNSGNRRARAQSVDSSVPSV